MTIPEILKIVSYRLSNLNSQKATAVSLGNLEAVESLTKEIEETQNTINTLKQFV